MYKIAYGESAVSIGGKARLSRTEENKKWEVRHYSRADTPSFLRSIVTRGYELMFGKTSDAEYTPEKWEDFIWYHEDWMKTLFWFFPFYELKQKGDFVYLFEIDEIGHHFPIAYTHKVIAGETLDDEEFRRLRREFILKKV